MLKIQAFWNVTAYPWVSRRLLWLLASEDESTMIFQNVKNYTRNDMVQHHTRLESSKAVPTQTDLEQRVTAPCRGRSVSTTNACARHYNATHIYIEWLTQGTVHCTVCFTAWLWLAAVTAVPTRSPLDLLTMWWSWSHCKSHHEVLYLSHELFLHCLYTANKMNAHRKACLSGYNINNREGSVLSWSILAKASVVDHKFCYRNRPLWYQF